MKVKAVFKGYNKSLGYLTGQEYDLILISNTIHREDGTGICSYSSLEMFLKNWTIIKTEVI